MRGIAAQLSRATVEMSMRTLLGRWLVLAPLVSLGAAGTAAAWNDHASILPGLHTLRMLGINAVAMAGWEQPKADAVTLISNRHAVLESWQQQRMAEAYRQRRMDDALLAALRDAGSDREHWRYLPANLRAMVSRQAFDAAAALATQLERSFPARYTADPAVALGNQSDELDMVGIARAHSASEHERLERQVAALLKRLGLHTRALVRDLLSEKARP